MRNELKRQLIGTTSWLVPGTYYENARLVAQFVDFVELLVYTWDKDTKELLTSEIDKLYSLTQLYNLKYTVHLPTDSFENVKKAINFFSIHEGKIRVLNYVTHPFENSEFDLFLKEIPNLSVENLNKKVYYAESMVFDVGHYLLGTDVDFSKVGEIKEVHIMGVRKGKDHLTVDENTLKIVHGVLSKKLFEVELLCFEVFSLVDFVNSYVVWSKWKEKVF